MVSSLAVPPPGLGVRGLPMNRWIWCSGISSLRGAFGSKVAKTGDGGKGRVGTTAAAPSSRTGPSAPATKAPSDPPEARVSRLRDERPIAIVPSSRSRQEDARHRDHLASTSRAEPIKRKTLAQKELVSKFDDKLTSEVAESSRRSDSIVAIDDCAEQLIEALCLSFSGSTVVQGYDNRMEELVGSANSEAISTRNAEKKVEDKAKAADEKAKDAEKRAAQAEDARKRAKKARKRAEDGLATAQLEHSKYLQEALPVALDQARQPAVEEYQQSDDFNYRLLVEYKEGCEI
ncbi:hypothetical protein TIFTF001_039650 [Ficus carica]|uniref:Uncharacterized protein n=1 Tax=Ficus carica TaxID=3494 RepID=A0AA88JG24_FICCA|nr:hypothetical protein TIFTF001_039650 [Ficus carica]